MEVAYAFVVVVVVFFFFFFSSSVTSRGRNCTGASKI